MVRNKVIKGLTVLSDYFTRLVFMTRCERLWHISGSFELWLDDQWYRHNTHAMNGVEVTR